MNIATLPQRTSPTLDRITVLLVTGGSRFGDLARHLPRDWRVVRCRQLPTGEERNLHGSGSSGSGLHGADARAADVPEPDVVVLDAPGAKAVTAACLRHPAAAIVAVLDPYSDHQDVVDVLEAGADACVRSSTSAVVAAHVEACRRRQAA
ncbi:response regulator transcription factor [Dactylosporangium roseum]|uniref:Response regulator transcription factor n=1 Tax=Dactylosporangium roseum TaxID=47989 RepID=A0ABY5ZED3_9ACTN|nr:hypothetical protein [Dactylosporangium roseum]UWZ38669.1 response regulator transcription factor [Dactylosporangium roseum]